MSIDPGYGDRSELEQRRRELQERLETIEKDYERGLDPDSEERAVQLENAEVLAAIARSTAEELEQVERLLQGQPDENEGDS